MKFGAAVCLVGLLESGYSALEKYLIFAIYYAKNGNFQIDLEVRGGPGEFFHGQVIIKIGLNFHFLGVTKSPRPPQNLAVLTAVLSTVGGGPCKMLIYATNHTFSG